MGVASMSSSSRRSGGEQHLNPDAPEFRPCLSLLLSPPPPPAHPISHVFLRPWSLTPPPHHYYCYYSLSSPPQYSAPPLPPPAFVPCNTDGATSNLRSLPLTPIRPTLTRRRRINLNIPSNAFNCYKSSSGSSSIRYENHCHRFSDPSVVMFKKSNSQAVPVSVRPGGLHTTVMIRNIPNQYTRKMLVLFLDDFCRRENSKIKDDEEDDDQKVEFDLVYLPIDFSTKVNKGYAFVNFTTPKAVWKLQQATMEDQTWSFYDSIRKRREIAIAKIQGRSALVEHFEKSRFACDSYDYLPVCFTPPRNGEPNKVTFQRNIGELLPRQHQQTNGSTSSNKQSTSIKTAN